MDSDETHSARQAFLSALLPQVVFDGWGSQALRAAAQARGLSEIAVRELFPGGIAEILTFYSAQADARMLQTLRRDYHLPSMKIRERIATAVMVRLREEWPQREAVRRASGALLLPWHMGAGARALYATVDAIWREAGDTATDYNFYTKRALLAKVYAATLMVWLDEQNPQLPETEAFLRRRIEDVMQIEKGKARLREAAARARDWLPERLRRAV